MIAKVSFNLISLSLKMIRVLLKYGQIMSKGVFLKVTKFVNPGRIKMQIKFL